MKDIKELIKKCINSETAKILHDKLKSIWDNDEFIFDILYDLEDEESKQKMLDVLDTGLTDTDEITFISMELSDEYVEKCLLKEQQNEISKKLIEMLRAIWDYNDFIYGIISRLPEDERKQKMISIIEQGVTEPTAIEDYIINDRI